MADDPIARADDLGDRLVAAMAGVYGDHPHHRTAHATGVGAAGTFTATPEAAALSRAAHLQGSPVDAVVRFSNGTGTPGVADGARDGRGLAVKLRLPDGSSTDLVGLSLPAFFVRTPDDFLALMAARTPDPATGVPDDAAVGAFVAEHPESLTALGAAMAALPPVSYATVRYHGVHTFVAVDPEDRRAPFRYRWEPDAGEAAITDEEAQARPPRYLADELAERLAAGPASFTLWFHLAGPDDPLDDPTAVWPEDRPAVAVGHLELTRTVPPDGVEPLVFDPTRVVDGIACSDDPMLAARSVAYRASYARRAR